MIGLSRRHLFECGLSAAAFPLLARTDELPRIKITAESFTKSGVKGFGAGTIRNGDSQYFDALVKTGAKFGRIFFPFNRCRNCDKFGRTYESVELLKRILDLARARGIQLVVVGEFPGSDSPDFWSNVALRESFVENWQLFARTFGNDSVIAGLDLLNEPVPPMPSGKVEDAHALWRPLAENTIDAIRGEQVVLPIIYEGVAGGSNLGLHGMRPFRDSQVVYSIHYYTPHDITHQHVRPNSPWSRTIPYPAGPEWELGKWDPEIGITAWNRKRMELELRGVVAFQRQFKVPIYVGEFSCIRWAPNNSRLRYIADCLAIFKKFGWSWSYHEFRGWPGWDVEIDSEDATVTKRSLNAPVMNLLVSELRQN